MNGLEVNFVKEADFEALRLMLVREMKFLLGKEIEESGDYLIYWDS